MAQSKSIYDDIKKEIECPVCQEQFSDVNEPKVLRCQHTFCKSCLDGWFRQQRARALSCPTCREITECPNNDINSLPSNLAYKKLRDILKAHSESGSHDFVSEREDVCKRHKEMVKFYCEQCEICICSECAILEHRDDNYHKILSFEEGAIKQKAIIERKMRQVAVNSSRLRSYTSSLEKRRAKANKSIKQAMKELNRVAELSINSIRQHQASVTELLTREKSNYDDAFSKQLSKLTEKIQGMDNLSALSSDVLQRNDLKEMLNISELFDERIAEEETPLLNCPEFKYTPNDALSTPGMLYMTNTEPSLSVASGEGLGKGTIGEESSFTVFTKNSRGQMIYSEIDNVNVEIKSKQERIADIRPVVRDLKDGRYSISYRPSVTGEFSVSIKVREEPIRESPFKLMVTKETAIKDSASGGAGLETQCPICQDTVSLNARTLKCKHVFCVDCLETASKHDNRCPVCKEVQGVIRGNQPRGTMQFHRSCLSLPGYYECGRIIIDYHFPSGTQGQEHPNPGQRYDGTQRFAYLPDNREGNEVLQLLRKAFDARLVFTVGTSVTTGRANQVTWNGIHHKTSVTGGPQGFGYPDPDYLRQVKEDLAAKGIR
ncbi:tripartite motif-containing protein 3-like [Oculina patagonica]